MKRIHASLAVQSVNEFLRWVDFNTLLFLLEGESHDH